MKKAAHVLLLLGALAIQVAAPAWIIYDHERILEEGTAYEFETALVDPADPFRGRYVVFNLALLEAPIPVDEAGHEAFSDALRGDPVYVVLDRDTDGAAEIARLALERPGGDYLRAELGNYDGAGRQARLRFPPQRYYVPEDVAPEAERLLIRPPEDETPRVTLRVEGGRQIIESITVDGTPLVEYVRGQTS